MTEHNQRIYYILLGLTAVVAALTVMACIVIADWQLFYSMALAVPVGLLVGLVCMIMYVYPTLQPEEGKNRRRKRRAAYVPDPLGQRWLTAGAVSLGFALMMLCTALRVMGALPRWAFVVLMVMLAAAMYAATVYVAVRIHQTARKPVDKGIAWQVVLRALDVLADMVA
ncbi:MAG: hypothetical protein J6I49_01930 [Bacteroidales bacterium]|nr:hypothetical protein [Bacteroidales bacterium]